MRVLVIGASGQVGHEVLAHCAAQGHAVLGTGYRSLNEGRRRLDLGDEAAVRTLVTEWGPEAVVLTGAATNVDYCETHREEAHRINVLGPRYVAEAVRSIGARLVHLSTDYVFDGLSGPYSEDDPPHPISYYGQTKWEGEQAVQEIAPHWALVRTTWVFSYLPESKNFFMQVLKAMRNGEPIHAYRDQIGNPTLANNLARAVVEIAERGVQGTYNIVGTDRVSRVEYVQRIADAFDLDRRLIHEADARTRPQPAKRPVEGGLKTDKAAAALSTKLMNLQSAFDFIKKQMGMPRPEGV